MTPEQYCQQKAAPPGSTLYYSLLFLPRRERMALAALHAFRRELEEAVNEATDPGVARVRLTWWRAELDAMFQRRAQHPVGQALALATEEHALDPASLSEMVDGAQMDLDYNRYPDYPTLKVYCHRISSSVALLSARILGGYDAAIREYANRLGVALELVSIIAGVGKDARRNRVYIPLDELARFEMSSEDIVGLHEDERFERMMMYQIERARLLHAQAAALLPEAQRRQQRFGLVIAAIQCALLDEISSLRGRTLNRRISLTPLRKLWIAWRTWHFGKG